jgi:hypothetical protein
MRPVCSTPRPRLFDDDGFPLSPHSAKRIERGAIGTDGVTYEDREIRDELATSGRSSISGRRMKASELRPHYDANDVVARRKASDDDDAPRAISCSVALTPFDRGVVASDGRGYNFALVKELYDRGALSPFTRAPIEPEAIESQLLRAAVDVWNGAPLKAQRARFAPEHDARVHLATPPSMLARVGTQACAVAVPLFSAVLAYQCTHIYGAVLGGALASNDAAEKHLQGPVIMASMIGAGLGVAAYVAGGWNMRESVAPREGTKARGVYDVVEAVGIVAIYGVLAAGLKNGVMDGERRRFLVQQPA